MADGDIRDQQDSRYHRAELNHTGPDHRFHSPKSGVKDGERPHKENALPVRPPGYKGDDECRGIERNGDVGTSQDLEQNAGYQANSEIEAPFEILVSGI